MDGVEILNETQVVIRGSVPISHAVALGATFIVGVILVALFCGLMDTMEYLPVVTAILTAVFIFCSILLIVTDRSGDTNETHYEVTVSEEVSFTEFNNRYEVIEQRGNIFTVRERSME